MCLCIASSFTSAYLYRQIVLSMNSHMFLHCCGRTNGRHWYTQLASLHTSAEGSQYLKSCLRGWHGHIHSGQSKKESSRCTWTSNVQKSLTWHVCSCLVLWSTLMDWISFLGLAVPYLLAAKNSHYFDCLSCQHATTPSTCGSMEAICCLTIRSPSGRIDVISSIFMFWEIRQCEGQDSTAKVGDAFFLPPSLPFLLDQWVEFIQIAVASSNS